MSLSSVYRNAFVSISLTNLPPIIAGHSVVRKVFAEREIQIAREDSLLDLIVYREDVFTFYKTVSFINGPEVERIEQYLSKKNYRTYTLVFSMTAPVLAFFMKEPIMLLTSLTLYPLYQVVFSEDIREEKEIREKLKCLQFFEDALVEVDYHKLLREMDLNNERRT